MWRSLLLGAVITGSFCAGFAWVVNSIEPMLSDTQLLTVSFVSGFFGSIVARLVLKK